MNRALYYLLIIAAGCLATTAELEPVFFEFGGDDGAITSAEFSDRIALLTCPGAAFPAQSDVQDLFDSVDTDGSGSLDFVEFKLLIGRGVNEFWRNPTVSAFYKYAPSVGTKRIGSTAFASAFSEVGICYNGAQEGIATTFADSDTDSDGYIDEAEFVAAVFSKLPVFPALDDQDGIHEF